MMRTHSRLRMRNGFAFSPLALFTAGEQGAWYDPNDLSTLFQDSAGTTPVTAAGQPAGLMLDKRLGLVRGPELLTNQTWVTPATFDNATSGTGPSVSVTAGTTASRAAVVLAGLTAGRSYSVRFTVVSTPVQITLFARDGATAGSGTVLASNMVTASGQTGTLVFVAASTSANLLLTTSTAVNYSVSGVSTRELPGNHASQPTAASRPTLRLNATTGAYYLETDGIDDFMLTNSIDFTATDKVSLFTGIRKLSDAAAAILTELSVSSAANAGTFGVSAPHAAATPGYSWRSRGSVDNVVNINAGYPAPIANVLTGIGNISGDSAVIRINGSQAGTSTADQGAGNYGNFPLYLFRRAGTSLPFSGHFYGMIIVGRLTTDIETRSSELILANRTGVTLA